MRRPSPSVARRFESLPFSTKAREVTSVPTFAALHAARMFAGPAVKLIIAGTRPADIRPRSVAAAPFALGGGDHRREDGAVRGGGPIDQVRHDLVERRAGALAALLSFQRRIDVELHGREDRHGHLRPEATPHLVAGEARERR